MVLAFKFRVLPVGLAILFPLGVALGLIAFRLRLRRRLFVLFLAFLAFLHRPLGLLIIKRDLAVPNFGLLCFLGSFLFLGLLGGLRSVQKLRSLSGIALLIVRSISLALRLSSPPPWAGASVTATSLIVFSFSSVGVESSFLLRPLLSMGMRPRGTDTFAVLQLLLYLLIHH